ncbi:MAG TPA: amidohydrolase family protein [Steroidobacteraceae bacterium]|jgi:predicted TIM-barrel fold metal-dependent hydrolase
MKIDRRGFVRLAAAAASAVAGSAVNGFKAAGGTTARLIDVHHHVFPEPLASVLRTYWPANSLPGLDRSMQELSAGGTSFAMMSYPNYDILSFDKARLSGLIHETNSAAKDLIRPNLQRYGLFASLPLPFVDSALEEITYCYDKLETDGILLLSSYNDKWLGDASFAPVLDELNRRKAVVFVHPAASTCCRGLVPGLSDSVIEYETDTARTLASLLFSGTAERCPDIRFIFSHAGGSMPSLIERFTTATQPSPAVAKNIPKGALAYLRAFHYDTAQAVNPTALGALLRIVEPSQVLFGTDFPYRHAPDQVAALRGLHLPATTLTAILAGNAERLIPRSAAGR